MPFKDPTEGGMPAWDADVDIAAGSAVLAGHVTVPQGATGLVLFAHGSGSSRHSPRNRYVAGALNAAGLGTLLLDLLTTREEGERTKVFDIDMLATRLAEATRWVRGQPQAHTARVGFFGASTGAAAALVAAARLGDEVGAVVSRGGRPDLAGPALSDVVAPTLLIVGGRDDVVLGLNREAQARLRCANSLRVVAGATHLFEETGALETVAGLACDWFAAHLGGAAPDRAPFAMGGRP